MANNFGKIPMETRVFKPYNPLTESSRGRIWTIEKTTPRTVKISGMANDFDKFFSNLKPSSKKHTTRMKEMIREGTFELARKTRTIKYLKGFVNLFS